jgi:hypothetical protein
MRWLEIIRCLPETQRNVYQQRHHIPLPFAFVSLWIQSRENENLKESWQHYSVGSIIVAKHKLDKGMSYPDQGLKLETHVDWLWTCCTQPRGTRCQVERGIFLNGTSVILISDFCGHTPVHVLDSESGEDPARPGFGKTLSTWAASRNFVSSSGSAVSLCFTSSPDRPARVLKSTV